MSPYSYIHKLQSIIRKNKIEFYIPGGRITKGKDWYPFVVTFNDDEGFSKYTNMDLSLTVLYNFGHFESIKGSSSYYNPTSPYYSSFYGGYVIYNNETPAKSFGFYDNGEINVDELALVPKYDQTRLVLPSLGCPLDEIIFRSTIDNIDKSVEYLGIDGWTMVNTTIITNSPIHKAKESQRGYLQYGNPQEDYYDGEDFPPITLKGRVYVRYFKEYKATFALYILAPEVDTIDGCDKNILSKSRILLK